MNEKTEAAAPDQQLLREAVKTDPGEQSSATAATVAGETKQSASVTPAASVKNESAATDVTQSDAAKHSAKAVEAAINKSEWRVVGETVPGASHQRTGIPNQDALLHTRASSVNLPIILSISDGHGSNKCFRSDRGSRIGVHLATGLLSETLNKIYSGARDAGDLKKFEDEARGRLPAELVKRWRAEVEADLRRDPFREAEFERLIEKDGVRARELVLANPHLAYGATLLAVALTPSFIIYMQLGDGEIINVSDNGSVTAPLSEDTRLLANETTSLCLDKAAEDFRFHIQPLADPPPALILLTTDGYYNSFATTAGFHQVGGDLIEMMRTDGFDSVNRGVKGWLEEATQAGSGDDCTLAFIVRMDAIAAAPATTNTTPNDATSLAPPPANTSALSTPSAPHEQPASPKIA